MSCFSASLLVSQIYESRHCVLDGDQNQKNFKRRTGRVLEMGKNLHSENKELTKRMQESNAREKE